MSNQILVSKTFLKSLEKLPKEVQEKATALMNKFRSDPETVTLNRHRLSSDDGAKIYSIRLDDKYRMLVNIPEPELYIFIYVGIHDETYKWSESLTKEGISEDIGDDTQFFDDSAPLTYGCGPVIVNFIGQKEEVEYIVAEIRKLLRYGVNASDICVVARTYRIVDEYREMFKTADLPTYALRAKPEDRAIEAVRITNMRRATEREFRYIFIVSANHDVIPHRALVGKEGDFNIDEVIEREKQLLNKVVGCAQVGLYVTSYGEPSQLIQTQLP